MIDLKEGVQPVFGPIDNLLQDEFLTFWKYINKNLENGIIRHSKSLDGVINIFVKKNNGFLRMCVNYYGLNRLTINNQYLLPLMSRLSDQLSHAKMYTKIDLRGTYNLVCIWEGGKWKMLFRTRYDHFEYVMMPFGLTNAPVVFQHMMNDVFHEYLEDFVVYYINDILIFSKNMADHEHHAHLVLEKLWEVGLYTKLEKCGFHQYEVEFLGYIISRDGVCMDLHKVQTIVDWATSSSVWNVQQFLGFPNFY